MFLSFLSSPSSLNQLLRKFSSCMALYYLITSSSSLGNAPLSCSILSRARFHGPFCAKNPSNSNSFKNLLYSFPGDPPLLSFNLQVFRPFGRDPAVFEDLDSFQHLAMLFGTHLHGLATIPQLGPILCLTYLEHFLHQINTSPCLKTLLTKSRLSTPL